MQLPAISLSPALPANVSAAKINSNALPIPPQTDKSQDPQSTDTKSSSQDLSETDFRVIAELKKIDRGVRAHEAAHLAAAGGLARGGASFTYTKGPDGQRYAVGGEVSIDTSPERDDPEATILKAQRIQAAALAPAQPSDADRAVAASAAQMATTARAEIAAERYKPDESKTETENNKALSNNANSAKKMEREAAEKEITPATELYKVINSAIATEKSLGRLLDTAV